MKTQAQLPVPIPVLNQPASAASPRPVVAATGSTAAPGLATGLADDTYKLRIGDAVSFEILEDRILGIQETPENPAAANSTSANGSAGYLQNTPINLVVTHSGELQVPYIGRVMAVGKTPKQLAAEIKTALEKDYYKQATVVLSLNLASRFMGRVYIWGQVRQQGGLDIDINENLTAGKAILRAGGFADFANKKKVKVVRGNLDADGKKQSFELDMQQILEEGKIEKDIVLQPNDLIIVPSRLVNF